MNVEEERLDALRMAQWRYASHFERCRSRDERCERCIELQAAEMAAEDAVDNVASAWVAS